MRSRQILDALLPPGSLWTPQDGAGLDRLLDGIGSFFDPIIADVLALANLRNPLTTPWLEELEQEYGLTGGTLAEAVRRARLLVAKTGGSNTGTGEYLQAQLRAAGFDVYVHDNNPAVDPAGFLQFDSGTSFGTDDLFGDGEYFAARGGELLVNGPVYSGQAPIVYDSPADSKYWPLVFFIGGPATRNGAGELTAIERASIPAARRGDLVQLVVRYKPLHSWAGVMFQYV